MEKPKANEFEVRELSVKQSDVLSFAAMSASSVLMSGVVDGKRAAVFYYKDLYGRYQSGWHLHTAVDGSGVYSHFDHGVGAGVNKDLRYSYVLPYFSDSIGYLVAKAPEQDINLSGVFLFKDGRQVYGVLKSTTMHYAKEDGRQDKTTFIFNRAVVTKEFVNSIVAQVPLPSKDSDIWSLDEGELGVEQRVFYHDGERVGFGKVYPPEANKRFQRYKRKMISSSPIPSIKVGWCSEERMFAFLQLDSLVKMSRQ